MQPMKLVGFPWALALAISACGAEADQAGAEADQAMEAAAERPRVRLAVREGFGFDPSLVIRFSPTKEARIEREILERLNEFLAPKEILVEAGTDLRRVIESECGHVSSVYVERFIAANPSVNYPVVDTEASIQAPACPYWRFEGGLATIAEGGTIYEELLFAMGAATPTTLESVYAMNPYLIEENRVSELWVQTYAPHDLPARDSVRGIDHVLVYPGEQIRVPWTVHSTSFSLRPQFVDAPRQAIEALLMSPNAVTVEFDGNHVQTISDADDEDCNSLSTQRRDWPFNPDSVMAVLRRNREIRRGRDAPGPVVVGVVDNGVQRGESRIPFDTTGLELTGRQGYDDDGNDWNDDVIGSNMYDKTHGGYPLASKDYVRGNVELGHHGTHVAGLVAGHAHKAFSTFIRDRVRIRVLNILKRTEKQLGNAVVPDFSHPLHGLTAALEYGDGKDISIFNFSLESRIRLDDFRKQLGLKAGSMLVVAAAGNTGDDLDEEGMYPATYQRDLPRTIVAVAAHNALSEQERALLRRGIENPRQKLLLARSNWGAETVDLAAPGCRIESLVFDGKRERISGTSQAAALVSMTAALLRSEGITKPGRLKARIIGTVDRVPGLPVNSEGVLNVTKALSVHDDIVELSDGKLIRGQLEPLLIQRKGHSDSWRHVVKVIPLRKENGEWTVRVTLWKDERVGGVRHVIATTTVDTVVIKPLKGSGVQRIPLAGVLDIVPRAQEFRTQD